MTETKEKRDVYALTTDKIIAQLEQGVAPWQKSWTEAGIPQNLITRKPYQGINLILLASLNYEQNFFLTFNQIKMFGGKVVKGERSHLIVYWNWQEKVNEQGEKEKKSFLRYYLVFNIAQCEGIPKGMMPEPVRRPHEPIAVCEDVLRSMPLRPEIMHKEHEPFYHVGKDFINIPQAATFTDSESYYETLFHELIHSTGHISRLNRKEIMEPNEYGSEPYSIEELTAEIGACYLKSYAGIDRERLANSAAYIQGWLAKLRNDKRFIFYASSQAQKATDYILNMQAESEEKEIVSEEADLPF
jgi:antirestriction protein ArdC